MIWVLQNYLQVCALYFSLFNFQILFSSPNVSLFSLVVQTILLPFLLPADSLQRSLYLPYNPPRDVCVSAPTGSGKTLAYVLPIIEVYKFH